MKLLCNPMEIAYKYQHPLHGKYAYKEAADPTLVYFKGRYFLFTSKCGGFYYSDDLVKWDFHEDRTLEIHGYAPDVSVRGEWLYFCASSYAKKCKILRSKDPFKGFELVNAPFAFWDPHLYFEGEKAYLYWGCSSKEPIHGVEMDVEKMTQKGERFDIVSADPAHHGIDDKSVYEDKRTLWQKYIALFTGSGTFVEGAFLNKIGEKYYFQYATPGTEFPTYGDAVLVGDSPKGPFTWQKHNPYSLVPSGFTQGAGHGSTFEDEFGNLWHTSSVCVCVNHNFERRLGLWPAGVDEDGLLFCNQYFADYPKEIPDGKFDARKIGPAYMLLSYKKKATASSSARKGMPPQNAVDESIKSMWQAESGNKGEWLCIDLGAEKDVRCVQVNFGDFEVPKKKAPRKEYGGTISQERFIDTEQPDYVYTLEVSSDGKTWQPYAGGSTKLPHKLWAANARARYVRITFESAPFGQRFALCGLRVFGFGGGALSEQTKETAAKRLSPTRAKFSWAAQKDATGHCIRLGIAPDKLYTSVLLYDENEYTATFLDAGTQYFYAVDAFNENGITQGEIRQMEG